MTIEIGNYVFSGPFKHKSRLENQSGVYAVLGRNFSGNDWNVVDIGESQNVRDRIENHEREDCWEEQAYTYLEYAAFYCDEFIRMGIEQELREQENLPCGER